MKPRGRALGTASAMLLQLLQDDGAYTLRYVLSALAAELQLGDSWDSRSTEYKRLYRTIDQAQRQGYVRRTVRGVARQACFEITPLGKERLRLAATPVSLDAMHIPTFNEFARRHTHA